MITQKLPSAQSCMLTVGSTAKNLLTLIREADSPTTDNFNYIDGVNFAELYVEVNTIRYLVDGNVPTASIGIPAYAGDLIRISPAYLDKVQLIRASGSDATVVVVRIGKAKAGEF